MAIIQPPNFKGGFIKKGGAMMRLNLNWHPTFSAQRNAQFSRKQKFIDSECLRHCDPLTPKQTGNLINSGKMGTKIGSGELRYTAPYAAPQYYNTAESRAYDPRRGAHWFERMKVAHKKEILKGAKKIG